ncbi:MAG TPA: leucyl aminopeptidase, partial [Colwellia sp.]|nr:leucyl aminopeptidase [Colwellia sp.]
MKTLLTAKNHGTPLFVFEQKYAFESWLSKQTPFSQNWLTQINFSGNGLALIPNEQGELA